MGQFVRDGKVKCGWRSYDKKDMVSLAGVKWRGLQYEHIPVATY